MTEEIPRVGRLAGICGVDASDEWQKVKVDADHYLYVRAADKPFSVKSVIGESLSNANLSAGINTLTSALVPTGKLWVVTFASWRMFSSSISWLLFYFIHNAAEFWQTLDTTPVSNKLYVWNGWVVLDAGDYIRVYVDGATAGDDLHFHYLGFQMDAP